MAFDTHFGGCSCMCACFFRVALLESREAGNTRVFLQLCAMLSETVIGSKPVLACGRMCSGYLLERKGTSGFLVSVAFCGEIVYFIGLIP